MMTKTKKTLYSLAVFIISLAISEGFVRIFHPFDFDPKMFVHDLELGEAYKAPYTGSFRGVPVKINEEGARIPLQYQYIEKKSDPAVIFIGDSFTFGDESPAEESFPEIFYQIICKKNGSGKIKNFGVCGYGPKKYAILAKRKLNQYKPDFLVTAFYVGNDFEEDISIARRNYFFNNIIKILRENTYLFKVALDLYFGGRQSFSYAWLKKAFHNKDLKIQISQELSASEFLDFVDEIYRPVTNQVLKRQEGWLTFLESVNKIRSESTINKTKNIWIIIPKNIDPSVIGVSCAEVSYTQVQKRLSFFSQIEAALARPGEPVINALSLFAEGGYSINDLDEKGVGHFGRLKNLIIAKRLAQIYEKNLNKD